MEKTRCPLRPIVIFKNYFFLWLHFSAESVNCSVFLKNLEKTFLQFDLQKKKLRQTHRKFTATFIVKIYRLSISPEEIEIYRISVSPRAFLKLSIIVIALVQNGLSCPSLGILYMYFFLDDLLLCYVLCVGKNKHYYYKLCLQ